MIAEGIVDRIAKFSNRTNLRIHFNQHGAMRVAQVGTIDQEVARWGRGFVGGNQIIANGIAPVQAIPTTAAAIALYNADTSNTGRSLVVDLITYWLGSGTPAAGSTLMVAVGKPTVALPTTNSTGWGMSSASGSKNTSVAFWSTTSPVFATSPVAPAWVAVLGNAQAAAANVGQGQSAFFGDGRIIVPPGWALGFAILSGAGTTPLYGISAMWDEVELDLE